MGGALPDQASRKAKLCSSRNLECERAMKKPTKRYGDDVSKWHKHDKKREKGKNKHYIPDKTKETKRESRRMIMKMAICLQKMVLMRAMLKAL
jgi:hypothetical protein